MNIVRIILNHKLFEIFFEKMLIAFILIVAANLANQSLERYKLIEAQRVAGISTFVSACQEIWSKIFEYESSTDDLIGLRGRLKYSLWGGQENQDSATVAIKEKSHLSVQQFQDLKMLINNKKVIIGSELADYFHHYIALVTTRANARNDAIEAKNDYEAKIAKDVAEKYDKKIKAMRFTLDAAREIAISRLPNQ